MVVMAVMVEMSASTESAVMYTTGHKLVVVVHSGDDDEVLCAAWNTRICICKLHVHIRLRAYEAHDGLCCVGNVCGEYEVLMA